MSIEIIPPKERRPAVFLECEALRQFAEGSAASDVRPALERVRAAGFMSIGIANRPDSYRGPEDHDDLAASYTRLRESLGLDEIRACWHDPAKFCLCRMPGFKLLIDAASDHWLALGESYLVGISHAAIAAGYGLSVPTILVADCTADEKPRPDVRASTLVEALEWIVERANRSVPAYAGLKTQTGG